MSGGPLAGVRVVDLSRVLAGPFATMTLADLGADVVKVERPGTGDETRAYGPPWVPAAGGAAAYFVSANRNKRSLALDLKAAAGREVVWRLLEGADVLVSNFRPGVMERLGLSWPAVRDRRPRVVYAVVNGYGADGPAAGKPAFDVVVQGESGIMDLTGHPDGPPTRVGVTLGDETAGILLVTGILAALRARDRTGRGQRVEVALHDALLALLAYHAQAWWAGGPPPTRMGNAHPTIVPYGAFRAADGWFVVGVGNADQWTSFCEVVGSPEWADDPRFRTNGDRVENRAALAGLLAPILAGGTAAEWVARFDAAGVPAGRVRSVPEALASPEGRDRMTTRIATGGDELPLLACPIRLSDDPPTIRRPPPALGEHTDEVLAEAGYGTEAIAALRAKGVVA